MLSNGLISFPWFVFPNAYPLDSDLSRYHYLMFEQRGPGRLFLYHYVTPWKFCIICHYFSSTQMAVSKYLQNMPLRDPNFATAV